MYVFLIYFVAFILFVLFSYQNTYTRTRKGDFTLHVSQTFKGRLGVVVVRREPVSLTLAVFIKAYLFISGTLFRLQ